MVRIKLTSDSMFLCLDNLKNVESQNNVEYNYGRLDKSYNLAAWHIITEYVA